MNEPQVSPDLLREVIDALPRSVVVTDAQGVIVLWSAVAERLFGWAEDEVAGRPIGDVVEIVPDPADHPPATDGGDGAPGSWQVERTLRTRDGAPIRIRAVTRPLLDAEGQLRFLVTASEDLEAVRQLEATAQEALRLERLQRDRLEVVSAVNEALEASTDLADLMARVTSVVVPRLGDWCTLYAFASPEDDEPLVEVAHVDPSMVRYARELQARMPFDPDAPSGVAKVIRTAEPEFRPDIPAALLAAEDASPEIRRIVEELALRSVIAVPLRKGDRVLGALQLVMSDGHRHYTQEDLDLAQAVGARITATLDNRQLRDARARTAAVDARLADLGWKLAAAGDLEQVLAVIADDTGEVMGADDVAVGLIFDAEHIHVVRPDGDAGGPARGIAGYDVHELSTPSAAAKAVLTRQRQFVEGAATRGALPDRFAPHARSLIASPLFDADHHPIGVLVLSWNTDRRFDAFDRTAVETLSRLCGQAVRRAESSDYTNHLAALAGSMAAARTTEEVARLLRDHGAVALRASVANLRLLDRETGMLRAIIDSSLPQPMLDRYQQVHLSEPLPPTDAARADAPVWVEDLVEFHERYPVLAVEAESAGLGASAAIPLHASDGSVIGAVSFAWNAAVWFDRPTRTRLATLCELAAQTLERVSLYEAEHALITTMQRQLLTPLPEVTGLELAALYEPAAVAVGMGGDWYDAIPLPDGSLVAIIGDIVGHGVEAVAAMSRLQHLITVLIHLGTPLAEVYERANALSLAADPTFATSSLLHIDTDRQRIGILSAGHPPPLLRTPDGHVRLLDGGRQAMLGTVIRPVELAYTELPAGSLVLAYTDGLIEQRGEAIGTSIERLRADLERLALDGTIDDVLERILRSALENRTERSTTDDTAALVVRTLT